MAQQCQHIILTSHFMHVIAELQRIHHYRDIIQRHDNVVPKTIKIHGDIAFQIIKRIRTDPIALENLALQCTHHRIRIIYGFHIAQLITVIPMLHFQNIHSIALA